MKKPTKKLASLLLVALAALASIATSPPPSPPPEWEERSDFELQLGQGWDAFDPYEEGEALVLEQGPQGGQHINVTLLAKDLAREQNTVVTSWLVRASDEELLEGPERFEDSFSYEPYEEPLPEGVVMLPNGRLFVDDPDAFLGEEVELRVQVDPGDGRIGRVWFRAVAEMGPAPWDVPEDAGTRGDAGALDGGS